MPYKVKLEQFEGPLDLLLEIVESRKLNLVEISLADIAEQFLQYLATMKERSLDEITQFLVVGSRLALLKSRELVPTLHDDLDEDGELETLKEQLARYQPFREAAKLLQEQQQKGERYYTREAFAGEDPIFYFPPELDAHTLHTHVQNMLITATAARAIPQATVKPMLSLEECVDKLMSVARGQKQLDFSEFLHKKEPAEKIVHFVGMLELVRMGKMSASQKNNFGTIVLTSLDSPSTSSARRASTDDK